ncbi:hypothetical protein A0J61_06472 [Choanephora cucurbitarum]|uniref:Uncharacterized protein n=1 Tax=Choanephora cucurbitarum TaxID=101091 RepID=A0A1C7N9Y3_9FUNG|nr:hypothetical protein A0J61_06472 [Choanephora cucurbitarum]
MPYSFALPKFSGSTLEPQSEPIMLYEPQYYEKNAGRAQMSLVPTRPTPPLKRAFKPPHIVIPEPNFGGMQSNNTSFSAWSFKDGSTSTPALWDSPSFPRS